MNRNIPLLGALLITASAVAQHASTPPSPMMFGAAQVHPHPALQPEVNGPARDQGDVVWTEDFANGLAGNNPSGAWSTGLADGALWVQCFNGPSGAYSDNTEAITSTTAANGWMWFAADSANSTYYPDSIVPNPTFLNWNGTLESPVIDLSATPFVLLQFEQRMRYCCGDSPFYLEVSSDGGASWPTRFLVVDEDVNDDPGTFTTTVNISAGIASDPSNARFRFYFDGDLSGTSHYHWQIDDINIVEAFNYDLQLTSANDNYFDLDLSATYDSLEYTIYPYGQLRPIALNIVAMNNGAQDQTNVTANFTVDRGATNVLDQDQTVANIPAGEEARIFVSPDFVPPAVEGTYDCSYSITSSVGDTSTTDNSGTSSFQVDEFVYGRDGGVTSGYDDGDGAGGAYSLGNIFQIANDAELFAIDVAFRSLTGTTGTPVAATLRALDADFTVIATTEEHELVNADLNGPTGTNFVHLVFADPQLLTAGEAYLVCVEHYGGIALRTGANGTSVAQTSFIYLDPPGAQTLDWYYTTTTPMVRMNFDATVGIAENDFTNGVGLGQNIPNPASTMTSIPYSLVTPATVRFELFDVSGKLMLERNEGNKGNGAYRIQVDTQELPDGVYFYTLTAGTTRLTKRMTVVH